MPSTTDLLTRCPQCQTTFRVTAEQLAVRDGRVRCGKCQHAFDAPSAAVTAASTSTAPPQLPSGDVSPAAPHIASAEPLTVPLPDAAEHGDDSASPANADDERIEEFPSHLLDPLEPTLGDFRTEEAADFAATAPIVAAPEAATEDGSDDLPAPEHPHEELPAEAAAPVSHRTGWLFFLASLILILLLAGQMAYRFRTELATAMPALKDVYSGLNIDVPLPQHAEMISIEGSDLQADAARNLLILNASIKNRAAWSQTYPLLELTLTDARDTVLLRRSFKPADYLPADSPPVFGPHADLAIRLWLDTHGAVAAGYRLYVYYP